MKRRALWLPLAAVAGIAVYVLVPRDPAQRSPVVAHAEVAASVAEPPAVPQPLDRASGPQVPDTAPENTESETIHHAPLAQLMPKTEKVREELTADPHTTPPALMSFSMAIHNRFEEAVKSENGAQAFFPELESCALSAEAVDSVKAYCLLNAKRLAESYPSIAADYHSLESRVDARALTIMKAIAF